MVYELPVLVRSSPFKPRVIHHGSEIEYKLLPFCFASLSLSSDCNFCNYESRLDGCPIRSPDHFAAQPATRSTPTLRAIVFLQYPVHSLIELQPHLAECFLSTKCTIKNDVFFLKSKAKTKKAQCNARAKAERGEYNYIPSRKYDIAAVVWLECFCTVITRWVTLLLQSKI